MTFFLIEDLENPYILEFYRVHDIKQEDSFCGMEYIIWIHGMHTEFRKQTGWGDMPGDPEYQYQFIEWLKTKEAIK